MPEPGYRLQSTNNMFLPSHMVVRLYRQIMPYQLLKLAGGEYPMFASYPGLWHRGQWRFDFLAKYAGREIVHPFEWTSVSLINQDYFSLETTA